MRRISPKLPGVTRRLVHGEVDGTPYRAHFEGRPSKEAMDALEEIVKAVAKMTPAEIEAARKKSEVARLLTAPKSPKRRGLGEE